MSNVEAKSINLGMRLSVWFPVTLEELQKLQGGKEDAQETLMKILYSDRCSVDGDTYFPEPWNDDYLTEDLNFFDLPSAPLHPPREMEKENMANNIVMSKDDFTNLTGLLEQAAQGFIEYTRTLENSDVCEEPLFCAQSLLDKYAVQERSIGENQPTMLYLSQNLDKTWQCTASDVQLSSVHVPFLQEQAYPVDLYFTRIDSNGSAVMEKAVCENRSDLLESLNWLGKIGGTVESLWDFDAGQNLSSPATEVFRAGRSRRYAQVEKEISEMLGMAETKDSLDNQIRSASDRMEPGSLNGTAQKKEPEI